MKECYYWELFWQLHGRCYELDLHPDGVEEVFTALQEDEPLCGECDECVAQFAASNGGLLLN